jgi:hypothetical protein
MHSPPDFHITETPTLHFVATENEQQLTQNLEARLGEALRQVEEEPEVIAGADANRTAVRRLQDLRKAERALHQYARESANQMAAASESALGGIIDSAVHGTPGFARMEPLAGIEMRSRYTARAIERVVEHLLPVSEIAQLRAESHELMIRARAVEKVAQGRAEKLLGRLKDAVSDEIVLPVDMSKGVAGTLLAHASGLKNLAVQLAENADRLEKSYTARAGKERI